MKNINLQLCTISGKILNYNFSFDFSKPEKRTKKLKKADIGFERNYSGKWKILNCKRKYTTLEFLIFSKKRQTKQEEKQKSGSQEPLNKSFPKNDVYIFKMDFNISSKVRKTRKEDQELLLNEK